MPRVPKPPPPSLLSALKTAKQSPSSTDAQPRPDRLAAVNLLYDTLTMTPPSQASIPAFKPLSSLNSKSMSNSPSSNTFMVQKMDGVNLSGSLTFPSESELADFHAKLELYLASKRADVSLVRMQKQLAQLKENGIQPTEFTYYLLIQVCIKVRQIDAAFNIYTDMKRPSSQTSAAKSPIISPIAPTLRIFETLIYGCVRVSKDPKRAFSTFDHMRQYYHEPNSSIYGLMMAACAQKGEAERAFDLFEELQEAGVIPTPSVFTSLIEACASRPDYYSGAFDILENMTHFGYEPDFETYRVLLEACAKNGDIQRIAIVWNKFLEAHASSVRNSKKGAAELMTGPNNQIVGYLLLSLSNRLNYEKQKLYYKKGELYGRLTTYKGKSLPVSSPDDKGSPNDEEVPRFDSKTAITRLRQIKQLMIAQKSTFMENKMAQSAGNPTNNFVPLDSAEEQPSVPLALPVKSKITPTSMNIEIAEKGALLFNLTKESGEVSVKSIGDMAMGIWRFILTSPEYFKVSPYLAHAYLQILCSLAATSKTPTSYETVLAYLDTYPALGLDHKQGTTYKSLIFVVSKIPALMTKYGDDLWREFIEWEKEKERLLSEREGFTKLEREGIRMLEQRGCEQVRKMFINIILGYVRIGKYDRAFELIKECSEFRYPAYLPPIRISDVPQFGGVAKTAAQNGDWKLLERLRELCPPTTPTVVEQVRDILKSKHVPKNWWGWEPMGYQKKQVADMMKQNVIKMRKKRAAIAPVLAIDRHHRPFPTKKQ